MVAFLVSAGGNNCGNGAGDAPYPATGSTPAPERQPSRTRLETGPQELRSGPSISERLGKALGVHLRARVVPHRIPVNHLEDSHSALCSTVTQVELPSDTVHPPTVDRLQRQPSLSR